MKLLTEFKAFALKGNVIDIAVGIIIGIAFGKIVSSIVNDIIMPLIGLLVGGVNFTELKLILKDAVGETPAVTLNYGNFLQAAFDFIIIAFSIFIVVKIMNSARKKEEETPSAPVVPKEEELLAEIRDLLKK